MALGELMTLRFSQLSLAISNNFIDGNDSSGDYHENDVAYADLASQRRNFDTASTSSCILRLKPPGQLRRLRVALSPNGAQKIEWPKLCS